MRGGGVDTLAGGTGASSHWAFTNAGPPTTSNRAISDITRVGEFFEMRAG